MKIEDVAHYLRTRHCVLWGPMFDLTDDEELEQAVTWLAGVIGEIRGKPLKHREGGLTVCCCGHLQDEHYDAGCQHAACSCASFEDFDSA